MKILYQTNQKRKYFVFFRDGLHEPCPNPSLASKIRLAIRGQIFFSSTALPGLPEWRWINLF
jgi:hypothetical protein